MSVYTEETESSLTFVNESLDPDHSTVMVCATEHRLTETISVGPTLSSVTWFGFRVFPFAATLSFSYFVTRNV